MLIRTRSPIHCWTNGLGRLRETPKSLVKMQSADFYMTSSAPCNEPGVRRLLPNYLWPWSSRNSASRAIIERVKTVKTDRRDG